MNYSKQQISQACRDYGTQLSPLPSSINGVQLLWALSGNESSFGADCGPRYEPAYDNGGRYAGGNWALLAFGKAAAMSYGPWQIMFPNCPRDTTPTIMDNDLEAVSIATIEFLNHQLVRFHPQSLAAIGAIWNGGSPLALRQLTVQNYVDKLIQNYQIPLENE